MWNDVKVGGLPLGFLAIFHPSHYLSPVSTHKETLAPLPVREGTTWGWRWGCIAWNRHHGVGQSDHHEGIWTQWGITMNNNERSQRLFCERRWASSRGLERRVIQISAIGYFTLIPPETLFKSPLPTWRVPSSKVPTWPSPMFSADSGKVLQNSFEILNLERENIEKYQG